MATVGALYAWAAHGVRYHTRTDRDAFMLQFVATFGSVIQVTVTDSFKLLVWANYASAPYTHIRVPTQLRMAWGMLHGAPLPSYSKFHTQ